MKFVTFNHFVEQYHLSMRILVDRELLKQGFDVILLQTEFRTRFRLENIVFVEVCKNLC
jgi:hypothetical protein